MSEDWRRCCTRTQPFLLSDRRPVKILAFFASNCLIAQKSVSNKQLTDVEFWIQTLELWNIKKNTKSLVFYDQDIVEEIDRTDVQTFLTWV